MAADKFADALIKRSVTAIINKLDIHEPFIEEERADMLVIMYPVYAGNAPGPIYDYIKKHKRMEGQLAAVICVSGGGDAFINKASRLHTIRFLKKKGCRIVYENMLVMPSNAIAATPEDIALRLMKVLPEKTEKIAEDLLSGKMRRTRPGLVIRVLAWFLEIQKKGARFFGRSIRADERCVGCGLCANECPTGNIKMENGKPFFGKHCATCLHCFYRCPENALKPWLFKGLVLKEGFDLKKLESHIQRTDDYKQLELKGMWEALNTYFEEVVKG